jgi:nucleoside-diphosphate kinase
MSNTTFIMLKPDAKKNELVSTILNELQSYGCTIIKLKEVEVTPPLILKHYEEVLERVSIPNFKDRILREFNQQVVTIAILTHPTKDVVDYVRELVGATEPTKADPNSLRGKYADDDYERSGKEDRLVRNLIHASDSKESAITEINLWFNSTSQ